MPFVANKPIMLSVSMLNVVMLNVTLLSVMAPSPPPLNVVYELNMKMLNANKIPIMTKMNKVFK